MKRVLAMTLKILALVIAGLVLAVVGIVVVAVVFGGGLGDPCPPYC